MVCFAFLGGLHVGALENCGPGNGALPRNCVSRCCCCWPFPFPPLGAEEGTPRILSLSARGKLHRKHLCFVGQHPPRLQFTQNHSVSNPPAGAAPPLSLPCILTVCPEKRRTTVSGTMRKIFPINRKIEQMGRGASKRRQSGHQRRACDVLRNPEDQKTTRKTLGENLDFASRKDRLSQIPKSREDLIVKVGNVRSVHKKRRHFPQVRLAVAAGGRPPVR